MITINTQINVLSSFRTMESNIGTIDTTDETVVSRFFLCDAVGVLSLGYPWGIIDVSTEVDGRGGRGGGRGKLARAMTAGGESSVGWTGLEGLEASRSIDDDAKVACEWRSDGAWSCFWVDLC